MEWTQKRKWITLALIGVMMPLSLLTAFKITGIIPEPQPAEKVTVDPVVWSFQRPLTLPPTTPRYTIQNPYTDETIAIQFQITGLYYVDDDFLGNAFTCGLSVNATVEEGYIYSVDVYYFEESSSSRLWDLVDDWHPPENIYQLSNLTITSHKWEGYAGNPIEAHVKAVGINKPATIHFRGPFIWSILNYERHDLKVTVELLYWTGSAYRKITLQIIMETYV